MESDAVDRKSHNHYIRLSLKSMPCHSHSGKSHETLSERLQLQICLCTVVEFDDMSF